MEYAGFNLLVGNSHEVVASTTPGTSEAVMLQPGVYGLSNAGLDTPWPKLLKARAALEGLLDDPQPEALLALLNDTQTAAFAELPDTGVGLATETLLSSVFIASPTLWNAGEYGADCPGGRDAAYGRTEFRAVWRASWGSRDQGLALFGRTPSRASSLPQGFASITSPMWEQACSRKAAAV